MPSEQHNFLSHRHFEGLKCLMRHSSSNLQLVAQSLRYTYGQKFKNNAKAKASKKGLSINIERAKGCPQTAVSVLPLPIIDTTPTPEPLLITIPPTSDQRRRRRRSPTQRNLAVPSLVQRVLSPISASVIQVSLLPATPLNAPVASTQQPFLSPLDFSSIPSISVSYFSSPVVEKKTQCAVSIDTGDAAYGTAPAAPAPQIRELPDVPVDADYWEDIDMSSSSRSSSEGPETPCDSEDDGPFVIRIRKRKTADEEDEELPQPKYAMKKRWSNCSNARGRSSRRKVIYVVPAIADST